MKRAIKHKIGELERKEVERSTKHQRTLLLDLVTKHYNDHPFFFTQPETIESLHVKNLQEIHEFCKDQKLPSIYSYLHANWYTWDRYVLWGRRNSTQIAFTKTTMTIEAHWSVVKRQYLVHNNRPRIDFVLYILEQRLMPKVEADFKLLAQGLKKPKWWGEFTKEWVQASNKALNGSYETNTTTWTCSCPAYMRSRFLICKHLINGASCPAYRSLVRNRRPPFLQVRVDPERYVPDMAGELLHVWSGFGDLASCDENFWAIDAPERTESQPSQENDLTVLEELLQWTTNHVAQLKETSAGNKQLLHIEKHVLHRLFLYRERVEKSLRERSAPKTWEHADTFFLP